MKSVEKKTRRMYRKYREACKQKGVDAVSFGLFKRWVETNVARLMAERVAALVPEEDAGHAYYLTNRVTDTIAKPDDHDWVERKCAQCQAPVVIDITQVERAEKSKAIICNVCAPEVIGAPMEDLIRGKLRQI